MFAVVRKTCLVNVGLFAQGNREGPQIEISGLRAIDLGVGMTLLPQQACHFSRRWRQESRLHVCGKQRLDLIDLCWR